MKGLHRDAEAVFLSIMISMTMQTDGSLSDNVESMKQASQDWDSIADMDNKKREGKNYYDMLYRNSCSAIIAVMSMRISVSGVFT